MATVPADIDGPSDAELIDAVRKGTVSAYGSLYERHVASAYNLARQLSRSPAEADDLVSEAFAKVLDTLRGGRGPDTAFRAYLLTALRHTAYDKTRRDRRIELSDDLESTGGAKMAEPFSDTAVAGLERSLAALAFERLPERWQAVLWHTEVEGQSPAQVAPLLGLTPNGVAALAYRAREGLRQAYLQVHLAETAEARCRATAERLGAWTRHGLAKREKAQVEAHLDECSRCRALAAELADVNGAMRGVVAPLVLGAGTVGYLAAAAEGGAFTAAGTSAVAGGAAGGAAVAPPWAAGGAANAATAGPRQLVGVAASGVVLAAAVVVGLVAGGSGQDLPAAAPSPTREAPAPGEPSQQPPAPETPPRQQPPPEREPDPRSPAPEPDEPGTPDVPEAPPAEQPAQLSASQAAPVSLVAGGESAELPITVRNSGGSMSEPVTATLRLPAGVSAVAADRYGPEPLLRLDSARADTVGCPGGTQVVRCSTTSGLAPGESVTLLFRVVAAEGSSGGRVTGTVSAGTTVNVDVSVRVDVRPPAAVDAVVLSADSEWLGLLPGIWLYPTLEARAENTGTSAKPVTVIVDQPAQLIFSDKEMTCTAGGATTCTTTGDVAPGDSVKTVFELDPDPWPARALEPPRQVHVTARLGSASDGIDVRLRPWLLPDVPGLLVTVPPATAGPVSGSAGAEAPAVSGEQAPTGTSPAKPSSPPPAPPSPPPSPPPPAAPPPASPPLPSPSLPAPPSPPERSAPPPSGGGGLGGLLGWLLGG